LDLGEIHYVSTVKVFFYTDGKTYGKPDDYHIEYWDGKQWLQVKEKNKTPSSPIGNTINTVSFEQITTTQIRINFKNEAKRTSIALTEMELY